MLSKVIEMGGFGTTITNRALMKDIEKVIVSEDEIIVIRAYHNNVTYKRE